MQSATKLTTALTLALAAVALSGCIGGAEGNSSLFVKDAIADDVANVYVTFTKAQIEDADGRWMTVVDEPTTIDLLAYSGSTDRAGLANFDLQPNTQYEGLRIMISEVEIVDLDGQRSNLNVLGNIVEIADEFNTDADGAVDIVVDFDLDEGVDLEAGEYTPVVMDVQTSDDDSDGDGIDDVRDADDDNDGDEDNKDDDDDGDGEDDRPHQTYGNVEEICAAERDEELAEAAEERDEDIAEAEAERDEAYAEAEQRRQENLLNGNATDAQDQYENETAEADRAYDEAVAEANEEYAEEAEEAEEEHQECLTEELDDDHDDDDADEDDEGRDDEDDDDDDDESDDDDDSTES